MAIDRASLLKIAPEFEEADKNQVNVFLDIAKTVINEAVFGNKYEYAVLLMAAHFLTLTPVAGDGGPISQQKVGNISVTYADVTIKNNEELSQTPYGVMYLTLRRTILVTPLIV